jgi:hypothetical protein
MLKLSRDDKASIRHALMHVEANNIHKSEHINGSWYCGNKEQFVTRHKKALALLRALAEGKDTSKGD